MWNIYGAYGGAMHYWHMSPGTGVVGSGSADHWYFSDQSVHVREIGTVATAGADSCTSTGSHVHLAVNESTSAVPYRTGDMNAYPIYFP